MTETEVKTLDDAVSERLSKQKNHMIDRLAEVVESHVRTAKAHADGLELANASLLEAEEVAELVRNDFSLDVEKQVRDLCMKAGTISPGERF